MKRLYSIIRLAAIAAVLGSAMVSCEQEPTSSVAKAVLGDVTLMNFAASNPAAQTVTVYSDGDWHTTAPEWITVDPSTGNGVTTVTVTAANNTDSQGMLEPRKDTLIISGNTLASRLLIFVSQEGDAYRNAQHMTLDKVAELADGKAFILDEATVVAVTSTGFVVNSGTTNVYIQSTESVKVGDVVSVKAVKGSPADEVTVKSSGTYTYPTPVNLNEVIATYTGETMDYVTVAGVVSGGNLALTVDEVDYSIKQVDCPADLKLSNYNGHKVELSGYTCGLIGAKQFGILTTDLKDKGVDQLIYFEDDFEWLAPYTEATGAGDAAATNNPSTTAPNVFGTAEWCGQFQADFMSRGYGYFEGANLKGKDPHDWQIVDATHTPPYKVLYLQKNYLKFGKSDCNSGIILPAMSAIEGTADVTLEFDWCWQITGSFNADIMTLTVEIVGNGKCAESNDALSVPIQSAQSQESGQSAIEWQHASVSLTGIDKDTRIKIRPTNYDPYIENPARGQNRWYLDNIKVAPGAGGGGGGVVPGGATSFGATWSFDPEASYESGVDYSMNNKTGSWLLSDDKQSKLSVIRLADADASKISTYASDATWGATCFRFLSYSVYKDDYWMFEVPAPKHSAGKCNVKFSMSSSAAGPKVFVLEYSTDGENWTSFNTKTKSVKIKDQEAYDVTCTFLLSENYSAANECNDIDETFDLPAELADGKLYVRARVNDTIVNDCSKILNGVSHGGTNRIGKLASITFTAN